MRRMLALAASVALLTTFAADGGQTIDVSALGQAAIQARREGRHAEAIALLSKITEIAPKLAGGWYALGQAYNTIKQDAIQTFDRSSEDPSWQQLLAADALLANAKLTEAFTLYRTLLERLPAMVSIHDSIARIYEQSGHSDWATRERAAGALSAEQCATRTALCEFRAGRYASALAAVLTSTDAESRYWQARAANELALAAFKHLDDLPDSAERRSVRATMARAEGRHTDAIAELEAALAFAPGNAALEYDLAWSYYQARDYEQAVATLSPMITRQPDISRLRALLGYSLLQLRRLDEAISTLQRVVERDATDPGPQLALGRAYVQNGNYAAAIPLIEAQLPGDLDGSLHVQLARAYTGIGQRDTAAALLARSQELQRAADERARSAAQRTITPPK